MSVEDYLGYAAAAQTALRGPQEPQERPAMPEWAPKDPPWCLFFWLALPAPPGAGYTTCIKRRGHGGPCRDQLGHEHSLGTSMRIGRGKHTDRRYDT